MIHSHGFGAFVLKKNVFIFVISSFILTSMYITILLAVLLKQKTAKS